LEKQHKKLDIKSDFPIFKISERVFKLDNFRNEEDLKFVDDFCKILDLGLKFVPSIFSSLNNFFTYFLFELENRITTKLDKGFIDTIIKSLKSSKCKNFESELNEKKIPIQKETLEIRNELFSKFTENNKFKLKNNLNNDQISCMKNT